MRPTKKTWQQPELIAVVGDGTLARPEGLEVEAVQGSASPPRQLPILGIVMRVKTEPKPQAVCFGPQERSELSLIL